MVDRRYKAVLIAFMSYHNGEDYTIDAEFTTEELVAITALDLARWFNYRAYGTPEPTDTDRPKHARKHSLYYWKKALSSFFPNRHHQWNELEKTGNPTKSQELNELINRVEKFETCGEGATSRARRPLKEAEFRSIMQSLRNKEDNDIYAKYGVPALLSFQFHMIGRIDDCCKWKKNNLAVHEVHAEKAAIARMAWSKNVTDERNAPWQHMFGCMDSIFCTILNVGLWLEVFHDKVPDGRARPMVFGFSDRFYDDAEKAGDHGKARVYNILRPLFNEIGVEVEDFEEGKNKVGSHSVRKYASTWTRTNGMSKDDKDHRGRWKNKRQSNTYDDVQLDWVDARVAAVLCPGGVCNYIVDDPACSHDWIVQQVTPNIAQVFGRRAAVLFGKAILWLAFVENDSNWMPFDMREGIRAAYNAVSTIQNPNPVRKSLVAVTGQNGQVYMEDIEGANNAPSNQDLHHNNGVHELQVDNVNGGNNRQLLLSILAQNNAQARQLTELSNALTQLTNAVLELRRTQSRLIRRYESNPRVFLQRQQEIGGQRGELRGNNNARRVAPASPTRREARVDSRAVLFGNIRDLHQLWHEWMVGIGGNKAAKNFTSTERGRVKCKYSRRKIFWRLVSRQVDKGQAADQVIDAIYAHYGPVSPTKIINGLREDVKNGTLPFTLR